jgi:predicted nucleic acid-binding protein
MGPSPSRLTDHHEILAVDASVAINLLGSGGPIELLRPLHRPLIIEETARDEVRRNPADGRPAREALDKLAREGLLVYARLSDRAYTVFTELTGAAPPDDLGDGEAATIAHAEDISGTVMVDDRKAERIALARSLPLEVLSTVDLLSSIAVVQALSKDSLISLTMAMLQNARMRVPARFREWIVSLIGPVRAAQCPSLGGVFGAACGITHSSKPPK